MKLMIRILAFAGSTRRASFNRKLIRAAARSARELGAEATLAELSDYPMPLYDGDLEAEQGLPETVSEFRRSMLEHDALLLACPEYNGSITPLLKNVIDWTSRPGGGVDGRAAYRGKVAGLLSASPGALGGLRGLAHVRAILSGIGVLVVPGDLSVGSAQGAFGADGTLTDEKLLRRLEAQVQALISTTAALKEGAATQ